MSEQNESYPADWKRVTVIVSPSGNIHALSGDRDGAPGTDASYPALEQILKWKRTAKAIQAEAFREAAKLIKTDCLNWTSSVAIASALETRAAEMEGEK